MIEIELRIDETSNRGTKGKAWIAETGIGDVPFSARSHGGASYALARLLVDAGITDQPVHVRQVGLVGDLIFPSLHKLAARTIAESATHPVSTRKWAEYWRGSPPDGGNVVESDDEAARPQTAL